MFVFATNAKKLEPKWKNRKFAHIIKLAYIFLVTSADMPLQLLTWKMWQLKNSLKIDWKIEKNFKEGVKAKDSSSKERGRGVKWNFWLPSRKFWKSKSSKYKINLSWILLTILTVSNPTVKILLPFKLSKLVSV